MWKRDSLFNFYTVVGAAHCHDETANTRKSKEVMSAPEDKVIVIADS